MAAAGQATSAREARASSRAENRARLMARSEGARAAMRHLDAHLRGRILDCLEFDEVLMATATDRAARAALSCVQEVYGITPHALSCVGIVSQLTRCRALYVCCAGSAEDLRSLSWPLHIMKDLREFSMNFDDDADMTEWASECDRLVRSGALRQLKTLEAFLVGVYDSDDDLQSLDVSCVECAAFKSLLSQLPLDCALRTAVSALVPVAWVSELLARGANPKSVVNERCVLKAACQRQRLDVIRMLLEAGVDPNFHGSRKDRKNTSPLCGAIYRKVNRAYGSRLDVVKLLLEFGADPGYALDSDGITLLHFIAYNSQKHPWPDVLELVKELLDRDEALASALWGKRGQTPLNVMLNDFNMQPSNEDKIDPAFFDVLRALSKAEADSRRHASQADEGLARDAYGLGAVYGGTRRCL